MTFIPCPPSPPPSVKNSPGKGLGLRTRRRLMVLTLTAAVAAVATGMASGQATRPTAPAAPAAGGPTAANSAAAADHFQKAKDLYEQKKYAEAMPENDQALQLDPGMVDAQMLRRVLVAKLAEGNGTTTGPGGPAKTLSPQQVSIIRLMELSPDDASIRGSVPRAALQEFWQTVWTKKQGVDLSQNAYNQFMLAQNFPMQAQRIRDAGIMKFIEQVTVQSDPVTMLQFSNSVHPYVLQNCATADCHGGPKGGNFRLIGAGNTPEVKYTNYFLLNQYHAPTGGHMIDRNDPDSSLLLQYSLPRAQAKFPHPTIDIRKIGNQNDQRYRQISDWIRNLSVPGPNYGITFNLPGTGPTSAPATTTTSAPASAPASRGR